MSPHTFELQNEVTEAIAEGRTGLLGVGELEPEIPKLTSSGLEVTILLFENHSDQDGRSRWLTDRELAAVSLLLSPTRPALPCAGTIERPCRHDAVAVST